MGAGGCAPAATLSRRTGRGRARSSRRRSPLRIREPMRALAGLLALACAVGLIWLAFSSSPRVDSVQVSGARHVRQAQAVAQSRLLDAQVFTASAAEARALLRELPAVREARVELSLPSSAHITLIEREAIGRWAASDGVTWFVDADGVLFASADPNGAPPLTIFDERPAHTPGERLDPALVRVALRLATIAPGELRADATAPKVVMTAGANGLVLRFGPGWEIRFGGPESFEEKLAVVKRYLQDNPQRRLDYVDVRSPDRIVVSPQ